MVAVFLAATCARAALPESYPETFSELSALIDGDELGPIEMMRAGWLAPGYFVPAKEGLDFNRARFTAAQSAGQAGLSGLFLALHGTPAHHQFVRKTLETDPSKRRLMWAVFGTEDAFFQSLEGGEKMRPLMNTLPPTNGLRLLLRMLIQSNDSLTRRAGLFWGYWLIDDVYRKAVNEMALNDLDAVNRACARRLLKGRK